MCSHFTFEFASWKEREVHRVNLDCEFPIDSVAAIDVINILLP
jgi:hypothetical protein